jgi:hypothetical protein
MREAKEVERFGLSLTAFDPSSSGEPPELQQARLLRMQSERKSGQTLLQVVEEAVRV